MDHNLWRIFRAVSDTHPDREAVVWRKSRWTYGELAGRATRLANVLVSHGLGVQKEQAGLSPWESGQDLLGLYLLNGPEYMEATLGGYGARTAPFNVNYRYVADELAYLLNDAGAQGLVYHECFAPTVAEVLPRLDRAPRLLLQVSDGSGHGLLDGALDYEEALTAAATTVPALDHSPDDLYVLYTGGTTGMPKGTLWRQADIWWSALGGDMLGDSADLDAIVAAAEGGAGQTFLPNAPLMHGAAHWLALRQLLTGGRLVINSVVDRLDPVDLWQLVEEEKVNATLLVGEAFARPVIAELERGTYDASSLALVVVGGATTSPDTKARMLQSLPHAMVLDAAGSSETGGALSQIAVAGNPGEAAIFNPNADVAVLDASLTTVLEPGHEGAGWFAKTGRIPLGYLGDQDKTERTFPTVAGRRWSVPGDRARLRTDGTLELLGRDSVSINSAGEKIFAEEVEQAVLTHPAVADAVVVGRDSERWGQEVVAVVQLAEGATATDDEIIETAGGSIARYKLPKAIVRVDAILRSPAGKADYGWARDIAGAG